MFTISNIQIFLVVLMVLSCVTLMLRNRVNLTKLVVIITLTLLCVLELFWTPLSKRISFLEHEISQKEKYAAQDPNLLQLKSSLTNAQALQNEVNSDPRRWPERLPFNLGLDLRGGTEIRLALKLDPVRLQRLQLERENLKHEIEEAKSSNPDSDLIKDLEEKLQDKGKELAYERTQIDQDLANAVDVVRRRLNNSGLSEIPVTRQGSDKVLIQLPGMDKSQADDTLSVIQKQGNLEFRLVVSDDDLVFGNVVRRIRQLGFEGEKYNIDEKTLESIPPEQVGEDGTSIVDGSVLFDWLKSPDEVFPDGQVRPGNYFLVKKHVELRGDSIAIARAEPDPSRASWRVVLEFNNTGAKEFERVTGDNIGKNLAIVLDGQLQSAPVIQARISGGHAEISGNFDQHSAKQLDVVLKSGSLKVKIEKEYDNTVGATLGEDSIKSSLTAMIIGAGAVLLFMLVYYMLAGLVTDAVLVLNMLIIFAVLSMLNATMTLTGFAGLVLTIGMAVDANVLIFERIREERARGNNLIKSLQLGYERAFTTIVDSNLTTILTALILHHFGTEQVRGFALTLMFGILASMFCSVVVTRWIFEFLIEYRLISDLKMMKFFDKANFDFVKHRRLFMGISLVCIIIGMAVFFYRGERNLGQDFTGGVLANIVTSKPLTMSEARGIADKLELFSDVRDNLQSYGQPDSENRYNEFVVRTTLVELDQAALQIAKKNNINKFTADDFRKELAKYFSLVPEGFVITDTVDNLSTADSKALEVKLSLEEAITSEDLRAVIDSSPLIKAVFVAPAGDTIPSSLSADKVVNSPSKSAKEFILVVLVPVTDLTGSARDEASFENIVRESLQSLRREKKLEFTDPFPRFTSVGRTVAKAMEADALKALFWSVICIFAYIWLRFQFRVGFGMGAIISLVHDVLLVLGTLAIADQLGLLNGQIDLVIVAAILTLIGYSLNDTIVVFDRIREHVGESGKPTASAINLAINETLSRTIITGITTLFVIIALLIFGGSVLRGFSFTLLVGVVVGTYSSIFIATPVLVEFSDFKAKREKKKTTTSIETHKNK